MDNGHILDFVTVDAKIECYVPCGIYINLIAQGSYFKII